MELMVEARVSFSLLCERIDGERRCALALARRKMRRIAIVHEANTPNLASETGYLQM